MLSFFYSTYAFTNYCEAISFPSKGWRCIIHEYLVPLQQTANDIISLVTTTRDNSVTPTIVLLIDIWALFNHAFDVHIEKCISFLTDSLDWFLSLSHTSGTFWVFGERAKLPCQDVNLEQNSEAGMNFVTPSATCLHCRLDIGRTFYLSLELSHLPQTIFKAPALVTLRKCFGSHLESIGIVSKTTCAYGDPTQNWSRSCRYLAEKEEDARKLCRRICESAKLVWRYIR